MAALITEATGEPVELKGGGRGEFTVAVDDVPVAQKSIAGFPAEDVVVTNVQAALA